MADKLVGKIFETKDYDRFKLLVGNRPVDHYKKLIESIKAIGVLHQPVLVNERWEVVEGQGRLYACRALNVPVLYTIQYGIGIKEARWLNKGSTNWKNKDYIHSWAVGDDAIPAYTNFDNVMKRYQEFNLHIVMLAGTENGMGDRAMKRWKSGEGEGFTVEKMTDAIRRLDKLREITPYVEKTKRKVQAYEAIMFCIILSENDPAFNIDQLYDSIKSYYQGKKPGGSLKEALAVMNEIYNYKRQDKNRYNIVRKYEDLFEEALRHGVVKRRK